MEPSPQAVSPKEAALPESIVNPPAAVATIDLTQTCFSYALRADSNLAACQEPCSDARQFFRQLGEFIANTCRTPPAPLPSDQEVSFYDGTLIGAEGIHYPAYTPLTDVPKIAPQNSPLPQGAAVI